MLRDIAKQLNLAEGNVIYSICVLAGLMVGTGIGFILCAVLTSSKVSNELELVPEKSQSEFANRRSATR